MLGYRTNLTAINHWNVAVATHTANHPSARHLCASLDALNPRDLYKADELDAMWASPECIFHSRARGGKPINDQNRATAWCVVRWAEALLPSIIWVENVPEFEAWGPLIKVRRKIKIKGRTVSRLVSVPDPKHKGEIFLAWCKCLEALGYRVDKRTLCAADYGDPTTRRRLFIQAVRGHRKICWPNPTHAPKGDKDMFGTRRPWRSAAEIIDWKLTGQSIFERKRPLSLKTLQRIEIGLKKFGIKPFVFAMDHTGGHGNGVVSAESPVSTVTTKARHGVVDPYLVKLRGTNNAASIYEPAPTVTAGGTHLALAEPFLVQVAHGNGKDKHGNERRVRSIKRPLGTVCGQRGDMALCEPMLLGQQSKSLLRPISKPVPTIATKGAIAIVEPFILPLEGYYCGNTPRSIKQPIPTVTSRGGGALCEPFLIKYYGTAKTRSIKDPLDTVTTKDRYGLVRLIVEIRGEKYVLDIRFRMLQPHELAGAQGFPKDYKFSGNKTQVVRQIGNAVPCGLAKAIVLAAVSQNSDIGKWL